MAYADQITVLIDALKLEPNSKERNKLLSKLEGAWAWAKVLDGKYKPLPNELSDCICQSGVFDPSCSVHKKP